MVAPVQHIIQVEDAVADILVKVEERSDAATTEFMENLEPLYSRRKEIVTGSEPPTEGELEGFQPVGGASAAGKAKGIPFFWLTVLSQQDMVADRITARDRAALEYLQDVRWTKGVMGYFLEFFFADNPFFYNKVLRRGFVVRVDEEGEEQLVHEEFTDIEWVDGKDLTVRAVAAKKKGKKGKKGKAAVAEEEDASTEVHTKPCPSFFRFFQPVMAPQSSLGGIAEDEDEEARMEGEEELTQMQADKWRGDLALILCFQALLPRAGHLYLEGLQQGQGLGGASDMEEEGDFQLVSGTPPASLEDLPLAAQKAVWAVRGVQKQMDALMAALGTSDAERRKKAYLAIRKLLDHRRGLLVNEEGKPAIQRFWVKAMKGLDTLRPFLLKKDERILEHLVDVRWMRDPADYKPGSRQIRGTLELEFAPNEYLDGTLLSKKYHLEESLNPEAPPNLLGTEVGPVKWKEGKDPTVKPGPTGRPQPAASFFWLFKKGGVRRVFNIVGEGREVQQEVNEMEMLLLADIRVNMVLHAASMYEQVESEGLDDDDDDEDDEEDDDDEVGAGADQSEEAAAHRAAVRAGKKAQGKGWGRGTFLLGLLAMMVLVEVFIFLDHLRTKGGQAG